MIRFSCVSGSSLTISELSAEALNVERWTLNVEPPHCVFMLIYPEPLIETRKQCQQFDAERFDVRIEAPKNTEVWDTIEE